MFLFETWVIYVSHVSKTRFCFKWKKQQNNYVIQNHVPDSPKRNAPQSYIGVSIELFVSLAWGEILSDIIVIKQHYIIWLVSNIAERE